MEQTRNRFSGSHCFFISGFIILCCAGILATAICLSPDPKGYGTHKKIGLPSCMTSRLLGLKTCPSCGLTTAFTLIGKGNFKQARQIHPWAIYFFLFILLLLCTAIVSMMRNHLKYLLIPMGIGIILGSAYSVFWVLALLEITG